MKYSYKQVKKAVYGTVAAAASLAGSLAAAFQDFPELAAGVAVFGTAVTALSVFFAKNEGTLDAVGGTVDGYLGNA